MMSVIAKNAASRPVNMFVNIKMIIRIANC